MSRNSSPFPFIFDRRLSILIYAFNSASASGGQILVGETEREDIRVLRGLQARDARTSDGRTVKGIVPRIKRVLNAFEKELRVDPAEVRQPEIELFQATMEYLRNQAATEVSQALKIAVLHHHLVPLPLEEVKKFESTINAGFILSELSNEQFHVVLHGHKHYPHILAGTSNAYEAPLLLISGGTIGGRPAPGQSPGFFLLRWEPATQALTPTFVKIPGTRLPASAGRIWGGEFSTGEVGNFQPALTGSPSRHIYQPRFTAFDLLS